ncbi:MAG: SDR family NAD(P)-dependent oxidoreductase [Candidatus Thiodiazotropha sp. (ex Ctena orbiculata)]|nr:SDR family NAD(P)-dependent oxidoreductase [Candidatus Thiodiazotropha taylori]
MEQTHHSNAIDEHDIPEASLLQKQKRTIDNLLFEKYEPIAIIGIGLDLPGGNASVSEFANFLLHGGDGVCCIPEDRWDVSGLYSADTGAKGRIHTHSGGYLKSIDRFDPKFFNISPKEAVYIDPQQRMVLETSWKALEHANIDPLSTVNADGGVYVGVSSMDYTLEVDSLTYEEYEAQIGTGTAHSAVSGRVSYFLGWRGPSVSIDTACSSSLVALDQAVQGLRRRECSVALCGGVNAIHHPRNMIIFSQANMLAPDGKCKTFDDSADGYSRSEGCGMIVLKRLSDAQRDGDQILALVRGSAVRQDGESGGLTVPNGLAQANVMRAALNNSLLNPIEIQYVEAHGTGTSLGDPIEMGAINDVFSNDVNRNEPILVGSVKTNIGHMEAAAGIGGVIKVAMQLAHGTVFPHINLHNPSKNIPWDKYQVRVPTKSEPWKHSGVRRAIVNSFGFSGTIATAVLEQAPVTGALENKSNAPNIFTVSAKTKSALQAMLERHRQHLVTESQLDIADLCYTSNVGRMHFSHRAAVSVESRDALLAWLEKKAYQIEVKDLKKHPGGSKVAFLFTGQGSQYSGMGYGLYQRIELFRDTVDECDALFHRLLGISIREIMFDKSETNTQQLAQTQFTQPALFTLEFALARLLRHWGVQPSILIGHSIGEIVAAAVSGLFSLADAVKLVATRARLMQSVTTAGGMLAARCTESDVKPFLEGSSDIALAAVNAPNQCVISGAEASLEKVRRDLEDRGVDCRRLVVSHAFHSPLMAEVYDEFRAVFDSICFNPPEIPMISNLSGEIVRYEELCDPDYWVQHIGRPVLFAKGMQALAQRGRHCMLELGPSSVLSGLAKQSIDASAHVWTHCLDPKQDDTETTTRALCTLYESGLKLDWSAYHAGARSKVALPHYAFEKKTYWLPVKQMHARAEADASAHPLLGKQAVTEDEACMLFRQVISSETPSYLTDHIVMQQVVFPGAAYMEMLIALQDRLYGEFAGQIADVLVSEPLFLSDQPVQLETLVCPQDDGSALVSISSRLSDEGQEIERSHVTARLLPAVESTARLDEVRERMMALTSGGDMDKYDLHQDDIYDRFESLGLHYGSAFQRIRGLTKISNDVVLGRLRPLQEIGQEFLHPSILDCAMQCLLGLVDDKDQTYLPVSFERFQFHKKPRGSLRTVVQSRKPSDDKVDLAMDIIVLDEGRSVFTLCGLGLKRVTNTEQKARRNFFHEPHWVKRSLVQAQKAGLNSHHLLFIGASEVDTKTCCHVMETSELKISAVDTAEAALQLLSMDVSIDGLCYFWQPSMGSDKAAMLDASCRSNYQSLLQLVKGLDELPQVDRNLRLWLVTEGGQWLPGDQAELVTTASLGAASLWGFGHVLLNENPLLRTCLVDLPPRVAGTELHVQGLVDEWCAWDVGSSDYQVAYRGNIRYVRRIAQADFEDDQQSSNYELQITEYGLFENIKPVVIEELAPQGDQVQIEMRSVGLNFKDVLNALGLLRKHAEQEGLEYHSLPLGFEGSGVVVARGDDAKFQIGDEVMLSHLGCMKRRLTVPSLAVVKKPPNLDFDQTAGIPTAYITAYYALHELAKIKAGDRVLIHAAAGGVGQAAVQLAQAVGAEVFATASPSKHAHLKAQGVCNLMNSRTLDFAAEINELTGGRGVDVVLNSLNKDYIAANLSCLGEQGRFVEMGKIGIWSSERMHEERPDVAYHNFDLSELPEDQLLRLNHDILEQVAQMIVEQRIQPLPTTSFSLDETCEAFSVLSRGANIGKLVLRMGEEKPPVDPFVLDAEHCYLVTGGYGALGKVLVSRLAEAGVRHIAVVSRSRPAAATLTQMRAGLPNDVQLYPLQADVSKSDDVEALFRELASLSLPLGAIFHAAGVLSDAPILKQDWDSFAKVFASKIHGSFLLHQACAELEQPPWFVAFSSIASVLGPTGQGNYAAANAFIDYLMAYRDATGESSLSINWGPWDEVGMAAELSDQMKRGLEEKGVRFLAPRDALRAMFRRLGSAGPQVMICEFDWNLYTAGLTLPNAMYENLANDSEAVGPSLSLEELELMSANERETTILEYLCSQVAKTLHFDSADQVEPDARFADLGLDSLVAVELKNSLEATFRFSLPSSLVFDYPSLPLLAKYLCSRLNPTESGVASADTSEKSVAELSPDEVDQQLAEIVGAV